MQKTLHEAQADFNANPCAQTAGELLATLMEYEREGALTYDTLLDSLAEIRDFLTGL